MDITSEFDAFQFQTGSIKSSANDPTTKLCRGFNSKLVRLKALLVKPEVIYTNRFQFQTGSIKRMHGQHRKTAFSAVSIPNWFD